MNVDRENRDRLADAIARYLDEQLTALPFGNEIEEIWKASDDPTVAHVAIALWSYYDDFKDHKIVLSKQAWNYFQRLILLLKSDSHVQVLTERRWSIIQAIAAAALAAFAMCVVRLGFGYHLLPIAIPFGIVSIMLWYWRQRLYPNPAPDEGGLMPFSSISELIAASCNIHEFSKRPYPAQLKSRTVRSPLMNGFMTLYEYVMWLFLSPLVLLFQTLPATTTKRRVVTPQQDDVLKHELES